MIKTSCCDEVFGVEINENIMRLIFDLERIVGNSCYNTRSSTPMNTKGKLIRYPVWADILYNSKKYPDKSTYWLNGILPEDIGSIHYEFGANYLYIGDALNKILLFIEKRYNLDFNELEEKHLKQSDE